MTPRERLTLVLNKKIPDCVPVCPDFSNMIPCRLTGRPFWDIYLYNDPPLHEAYVHAAKHFNIDSLWDFYMLNFPHEEAEENTWERFIIHRDEERIVTQKSRIESGRRVWKTRVDVYYRDNPPTANVVPGKIGLPEVPKRFEPLEGVKPSRTRPENFKDIKANMGDQGLIGLYVAGSCALNNEADIYNYYDHPELHEQWAEERIRKMEKRFEVIQAMEAKPDFIAVGGSGTLIFQTVEIFRQLAFPAVKRAIELATAAGLPTHVHSCGPEKELVKIMAEEAGLTVIDPLEIAPMGDCDLKELKRLYGKKIVLKGNLHTTDVMLRGTPETVIAASKKAIDDAAEGGMFILSTGDQCGRDTPDENIRVMVETARTYGRYR